MLKELFDAMHEGTNKKVKECPECGRAVPHNKGFDKHVCPGYRPDIPAPPVVAPPQLQQPHLVIPEMNILHEDCNVTTEEKLADLIRKLKHVRQSLASVSASASARSMKAITHTHNGLIQDMTQTFLGRLDDWHPTLLNTHQRNATINLGIILEQILPALHRTLDRRKAQGRDLKQLLETVGLDDRCKRFGYGRLIYTLVLRPAIDRGFIEPFVRPGLDDDRGSAKPPTQRTMRQAITAGFPGLALNQARQAEAQGDELRPRPTLRTTLEVVAEKFPDKDEDEADIPSRDDMPRQDPTTNNIEWSDDPDIRDQQQRDYGVDPIKLKAQDILDVIQGLNIQKTAGVDSVTNRFLRTMYENSLEEVERTLLPFFNALLSGCLNKQQSRLMRTGRLVLLVKGVNPDGTKQYRPLGVGCALLRLMHKVMMKTLKEEGKLHLQKHQYAVGVSDAGAIFAAEAQAAFDLGLALMGTDIKNAYNTMERLRIYREIRQHCPKLLRWFVCFMADDSVLMQSDGVVVGTCKTGVVQGDPMSSFCYCYGFNPCIQQIEASIKERHTAAGCDAEYVNSVKARAFADDVIQFGKAHTLLQGVGQCAAILDDTANAEMTIRKSTLTIPPSVSDEEAAAAQVLAEELNIRVSREGCIVMGIPVGTDEYIREHTSAKLTKILTDLGLLRHFTLQQQYTILLYCINTRPAFLQRAIHPSLLKEEFNRFDRLITQQLIQLLGDDHELLNAQFFDTVHAIRGEPQRLGGLSFKLHGPDAERQRATEGANHKIRKFFELVDPELLESIGENRWSDDTLHPTIAAAPGFDEQPAPADPVLQALKGHPLGAIPPAAVTTTRRPRAPETSLTLRDKLYLEAKLITHTETLNTLRDCPQNKQIAAQVLSASAPGTGATFWDIPVPGLSIKGDHFRQLLRLRLGVYPAPNFPHQPCDCRNRPANHRAYDENLPEGQAPPVILEEQPLHGLLCRKQSCAGRIKRRHDEVVAALASGIRLQEGTQVSIEPIIMDTEKRADLRVINNGETFYVDVSISCPATPARVLEGADRIQGVAAEKSFRKKLAKYAPVFVGRPLTAADDALPGFIPFIVETGGFIHPKSTEWLDNILAATPANVSRCYRKIARTLARHHGPMLFKFLQTLDPL